MAELNNEVLYCWNSNISTCYTNIIQNPVTIFPLVVSGRVLFSTIRYLAKQYPAHPYTVYIIKLSDKLFKTEKQYWKVIVNLQVVLY
jgi:hypothetical protein